MRPMLLAGVRRPVLRRLVRALTPPPTQQRTRHVGVIASTAPLTVYVDGGTSPVPAHALAHYTPVETDVVALDNVQGDIVVLGKFSS